MTRVLPCALGHKVSHRDVCDLCGMSLLEIDASGKPCPKALQFSIRVKLPRDDEQCEHCGIPLRECKYHGGGTR